MERYEKEKETTRCRDMDLLEKTNKQSCCRECEGETSGDESKNSAGIAPVVFFKP